MTIFRTRPGHRWLIAAALLVLALTGAAEATAKTHKTARPNVVVVMADDQDFRSMHALPKVRRLVGRRATTFATSIVNYPLCCPSRATYYTGRYAHNHGVLWNNFPEGGYYKFDGRETLPVWLRRAGYRTIHIGKYLNEYGERDPREVPRGWSDWHGGIDPLTYRYYGYKLNHNGKVKTYGNRPADYQVDVEARLAEKSIVRASRGRRPFFLNVAPIAPHTNSLTARREGTPAIPAPRHARRYANALLPRRPNFNEADISDKPAIQAFFPNPLPPTDIAALQEHYRGRLGSLLSVDDLVERIVRALKRTGEYRNTVIVYTSDNGWAMAEHRLRDPLTEDGRAAGVKYVPYEESSRVPLLIAGPGFPKGRTVKEVVVNADLTPTILSLTRARATRPVDGRSLLKLARSPKSYAGRGVLIATAKNPRGVPPYASIRTQRYRYDLSEVGLEGLFDLKADPWELTSFHADPRYARIKSILRTKLAELRRCSGASCRRSVGRLPEPG